MVQHNCGQGYKSTLMVMKTALSVGAGIVIIQELFMGNRKICHSGFNFHWPRKQRKKMRVMTAIRKDLSDKLMLGHRTDLSTTCILCY